MQDLIKFIIRSDETGKFLGDITLDKSTSVMYINSDLNTKSEILKRLRTKASEYFITKCFLEEPKI